MTDLKKYVAWFFFLALVGTIYFCLITHLDGQILHSELRSSTFDSLGENLLRLDAAVAPNSINWEGLDIRGKKYIYQGPFPALLRIPLNYFWPTHYGDWSRLSCLLAALLALGAIWRLFGKSLLQNYQSNATSKVYFPIFLTLSFGLGTPVLFLVSVATIYHEPILWGLATSLWCIAIYHSLLSKQTASFASVALMGLFASCSLLSRVTFGVPVLALSFFAAVLTIKKFSLANANHWIVSRKALLSLIPAGAGIAIQLWYNYARFLSPLKFMDYSVFYFNPEKFGGNLNPARMFSTIYNYFGVRTECFIPKKPFFVMETSWYDNPEIFFGWREPTSSLTLSSSWLVLLALAGFVWVIQKKKFSVLIASAPFLAEAILILCYSFVSERFSAEFLPLLCFFAAFSFKPGSWLSGKLGKCLVTLLAVLNIGVSILATLSWHTFYAAANTDIPPSWQKKLRAIMIDQPTFPKELGQLVYLSDLEPKIEKAEFRPPQRNLAWDGGPLEIRGTLVSHGFGIHASTTLSFNVPEGSSALEFLLAPADTTFQCPLAAFSLSIFDDTGRQIYDSGPMGRFGAKIDPQIIIERTSQPAAVSIPLEHSKSIKMVFDNLGNQDCDHIVLGEAAFVVGR